MTLAETQQQFMLDMARLVLWCEGHGYAVTGGELYRPKELSALYEKQGKGIADSNHGRRLAIDLNLFINGKYATNGDAYKPLGDFWEGLNPDNIWGGRFHDGNHFSRRYKDFPV